MTAFHEVRFPLDIARRSTGGPGRRTEIVTLGSGAEERNSRWADARRSYEAGYGIKTLDEIHTVIGFFEERRGRLHGFRWKDHADFKSCAPLVTPVNNDHEIGTGDGVADQFQLVKHYGVGANRYTRAITKPVVGTVLIAVNGTAQTEAVNFTLDPTTGQVTFVAGSIPLNGQSVTAGFEFDVPVRFDSDRLEVNLAAFDAGQVPQVTLVEVRS